VIKTVRREGRDLGDERMVGVKQETKVTSRIRGEDWGGGEKEGRVGDFRELDWSANKHEFSLGWVKREKIGRHPVSDIREERTEIVTAGLPLTGFGAAKKFSPPLTAGYRLTGNGAKGAKSPFYSVKG
jgi:hypothetical protein